MAENFITEDPEFFELDNETQALVIQQNFIDEVESTSEYQNASEADQQNFRIAHQQLLEEAALNSPHNPIRINQQQNQAQADRAGVLENTWNKGVESHQDFFRRQGITDDLAIGQQDDFAQVASTIMQKRLEQATTPEQKELAADWKTFEKAVARDGAWNDTKAYAGLLWDVISNPGGVLHTAAESSSSLTAMAAGAKVGGLAGPWGAMAGMFAAGTVDSAGHKMLSEIQTGMQEQGYAMTPSNMQMFLDKNPKFFDEARTKSLKYGAVLGLVDALTGGLVGKISTLPTRAARQAAMRSIAATDEAAIKAVAKAKNVSVKELTDGMVAGATRKNLAKTSFKKKLGAKVAGTTGEIASEPLSEAAATAAVGDEVRGEDLFYETVGGLGSGPIAASVAASTIGTKAGSKQSAQFAKKILDSTPESRAAKKEQKTQVKQAKRQANTRVNKPKYKEEISQIKPDDPRMQEWTDTENDETYDPIRAVDVLAQDGSIDSQTKIQDIEANHVAKMTKALDRAEAIEERARSGEKMSTEEAQEYKFLTQDLLPKQEAVYNKLKAQNQATQQLQAEENKSKEVKAVDPEAATSEEVVQNITETFGSYDHESTINLKQIEQLEKSDKLTPEDKELLSAVKARYQAREQVQQDAISKGMQDVQNDIYHGEWKSDFKGIDGYNAALSHYLHPEVNNIDQATKQIDGLKNFRDAHKQKLTVLSQALEQAQKANLPREQAISVKAGNKTYDIWAKSGRLVQNIQNEVKALDTEVVAAEALLKRHTQPQAATTTQQAQSQPQQQTKPQEVQETLKPQEQHNSEQVVKEFEALQKERLTIWEDREQLEHDQKLDAFYKKYGGENAVNEMRKAYYRNENTETQLKPQVVDVSLYSDKAIEDVIDKAEKIGINNLTPQQKATYEAVVAESATRKSTQKKASTEEQSAKPQDQEESQDQEDLRDPTVMPVTYNQPDGSPVTHPYYEARENIKTALQECQAIIDCVKSKRG